jgi:membrane protease subunit HflC
VTSDQQVTSPGDPAPIAAEAPTRRPPRHRGLMMAGVAAVAALYVGLGGVAVGPGQAAITMHFGYAARVLLTPGFYLDWPAPFGRTILIDTRLHATQSSLMEVTTADGQRRRIQAYAVWRIPAADPAIRLFQRAATAAEANPAGLIRSLLDTVLPRLSSTASAEALLGLNQSLKAALASQTLAAYGIEIEQAGLTQLTLPQNAIDAEAAETRARLKAEAAGRLAEAQAKAAEIRAEAERDARIAIAEAQVEAANIEAAARKQAAEIEGKAYNADPDLYQMLRSLDTLSTMVGPSTRLVLRTDAAPFNVLVQGPPQETNTK